MQIKNVREPSQKEKIGIVPKLVTLGVLTAILTSVIYICTFSNMDIGESMYLAGKIISSKAAFEHDLVIKLFEAIYGRDYMLDKFEGIPISVLASIICEAVVGVIYKVQKTVKGLK